MNHYTKTVNACLQRVILLVILMLSGTVEAAPFCAVTPMGRKCFYQDVTTCRQAAGRDGECAINRDELSLAEYEKGVRYCSVSSLGTQCLYHDKTSCVRAAARARGLCLDTREKDTKKAQIVP